MAIVGRGAEAVLNKDDEFLTKERVKKSYRLKEIDEKIRKSRTKREASLIRAARRIGVNVPAIIDEDTKTIKMEFLAGKRIKDVLNENNYEELCTGIAAFIALLHKNDIIHGDLTTSNMMLKENEIYFIDFGLGFISRRFEDLAVDLHLLKEALEAKHFQHWEILFNEVLKGYKKSKNSRRVLEQFKRVEKRGRYKEQY